MEIESRPLFFRSFWLFGFLLVSFSLALGLNSQAQRNRGSKTAAESVPAYHAAPPRGRLPATLPPRLFAGVPVAQRAYAAAAKIKSVLYQLPCYCHCDRELGHKSLLDCYVGTHASECATCRMELAYACEQHKRGKTAAQIRRGIIRGAWKNVDMAKWGAAAPGKQGPQTK